MVDGIEREEDVEDDQDSGAAGCGPPKHATHDARGDVERCRAIFLRLLDCHCHGYDDDVSVSSS